MRTPRILVVEDEAIIARNICRTLEKLEFAVVGTCATGEAAVASAEDLKPDLVLMDIRLEGAAMDGVQAADVIRQEADIPVIFITAHTDAATLERAKITGPTGYIVKPIVERDLHAAIEVGLHKAEMERRLAVSERSLRSVMRCVADGIIVADADARVRSVNPEAERITKWSAGEAGGRSLEEVFELVDGAGNRLFADPLLAVLQHEVKREYSDEVSLRGRDQGVTPIEYEASALRDERDQFVGLVLVFRDVSERRAARAERERLIGDLREALDNVKTLRGLLPVCSECKKVRDDEGYWQRIDTYIEEHSDAQVSHGICPDCVRKLYPEFADEVLRDASDRAAPGNEK